MLNGYKRLTLTKKHSLWSISKSSAKLLIHSDPTCYRYYDQWLRASTAQQVGWWVEGILNPSDEYFAREGGGMCANIISNS